MQRESRGIMAKIGGWRDLSASPENLTTDTYSSWLRIQNPFGDLLILAKSSSLVTGRQVNFFERGTLTGKPG
ncbi:MAG: hypothetical protein F4X09_05845 [Gammaproteobacteria bacterium]|nr:hypothetical protein [Gammaproteobacteria bacterium]